MQLKTSNLLLLALAVIFVVGCIQSIYVARNPTNYRITQIAPTQGPFVQQATSTVLSAIHRFVQSLAGASVITLAIFSIIPISTTPFVQPSKKQLPARTVVGVWIGAIVVTFFLLGVVPLYRDEPLGIASLFTMWCLVAVLLLPTTLRYWQTDRLQLSLRSMLIFTCVIALALAPPVFVQRGLRLVDGLWLHVLPDMHPNARLGRQATSIERSIAQWVSHGGPLWTPAITILSLIVLQTVRMRRTHERGLVGLFTTRPWKTLVVIIRDQTAPILIAFACWLTIYVWATSITLSSPHGILVSNALGFVAKVGR